MVVEKDFKQTGVGTIPADWEEKKLVEFVELITKGTTPTSIGRDFKSDGISFIKIESLASDGTINLDKVAFIDEQTNKMLFRSQLKEGDILFSIAGALGRVAIVPRDILPANTNQALSIVRINQNSKIFGKYLYYFLKSKKIQSHILNVSVQGAQANLSLLNISELMIDFPKNKTEQVLIATALSDMDELISQTEKLIKKKKAIKQGVMQELLRPKEGWVTSTLADIGEISGAGVDKKINNNELPVRLVNYMDVFKRDFIYSNELSHWVTAPLKKQMACAVIKGDVFFTPSSETRQDIALAAVAMEDISDAVYSYHLIRFRITKDWDFKFRAYIFNTRTFLQQAESLCEGGGKRYVLTLPKFRAMQVSYPQSKSEQIEISNILWDIDNQIWNLENKLQKLKLQKQGMMQALLTGKIRLV